MITRKMLFGEGNFSGVGNEHFFFFLLLDGILPPSTGSPQKGFGEGTGQSIHGGVKK